MAEQEESPDVFAGHLSDRYLRCRELGHVWRPHVATFDQATGTYDRSLRCSSCRTVRRQVLNSQGGVIQNGYVYADGYLAAHVQRGTLSRDVFRLEAITRYLHERERRAG